MEKRVHEASALRGLFDEQWGYLRRLIKKHEIARRREKQKEERVSEAVETIIEGTDSRIRGAERYQRRLRSSARGLLYYINELVSRLPAAIEVNQASHANDPLVKAFFNDREEMRNLFSRNADVQHLFGSKPHKEQPEIFALLQLSGRGNPLMAGEVGPGNAPRAGKETYVEFHDHALIAPRTSERRVRKALQNILFESVVEYLREYMLLIRKGMLDRTIYETLPAKGKGIENPKNYLDVLEWLLSMPRDLIRLQRNMLEIDSNGIRLPADSVQTSRLLQLNEVEVGGEPPRMLAIVRYPSAEL